MATKSKQEQRIDGIINACLEMQNSISEMDFRLSFYRLMEKVVVVTEEIENYISRSKTELLIDIDRGFSYAKKAVELENMTRVINNPRVLALKLTERNTDLLDSDDYVNQNYIKEATKRYIPYDDDQYLDRIDENDFIAVYEKAGKRNLLSANHVQQFFEKAIKYLIKIMKELDEILLKGNKDLYPLLYEKYFGEKILNYTIGEQKPHFDHWRDNHDATEEDDKWQKKIIDHVYICMDVLFRSDFLLYCENTLTEEDKENLRQEFTDIKVFKKDYCELFLNLCDLVEFKIDKKGIKFKPSEKKIGRYLYQKRGLIDSDSIQDFRIFLANLYLHQNALIAKPRKKLDYEIVAFQFKKFLTESKWLVNFVAEGYNNNYFEQFVDELMKTDYRDRIASGWERPQSREKMKGHLIGTLLNAGILEGKASEMARKYKGRKGKETDNFADYISQGKKNSKCIYSDWVYRYVND